MSSLPGNGTLRAALRWLVQLRTADVARARALFIHLPRFADLTPFQYAEGLMWLRRQGLVTEFGRLVPGEHLEAMQGLASEADPQVAEAVSALSGKVSVSHRQQIGAAGEEGLVALLRGATRAQVCHVAAVTDSYGYDIQARLPEGETAHIEVKATTNPHSLIVHLTRHEFETMRRDPYWVMAAVLVGPGAVVSAVATVSRRWLASSVPQDRDSSGRWESVRLCVPREALSVGIAQLGLRADGAWGLKLVTPEVAGVAGSNGSPFVSSSQLG
ncbi:DUF3883 domain-containing protein [Actinacidiphila oryziradicis]|uniref:DUF3883 domain-containing protein n=1 Tax=Actinacidiphila oryziradicis TaxID=2571141 RepID=A0A4U0RVA5_9ACTN|nr:DUF3883 domain-containing protein [Actinacidiphila oryziradicis]